MSVFDRNSTVCKRSDLGLSGRFGGVELCEVVKGAVELWTVVGDFEL